MSALSPRQRFLLEQACQPLEEAFGNGPYLVGTAGVMGKPEKPPRDIDVRLILDDDKYDALRAAIGDPGITFLGFAIGQYLFSRTDGLPIDFQIQRHTEANKQHKGIRNAIGIMQLKDYRGDCRIEPPTSEQRDATD